MLIKRTLYILIICFLSVGCFNKVRFRIDNKRYVYKKLSYKVINIPTKKNDLSAALSDTTINSKSIRINFDSGFDHYVQTYINDSLIFTEYLITNPSAGFTGKSILFDYSKIKENHLVLHIVIDNKSCIVTDLNLKYQKLHIRNEFGDWIIAYNDNFIFYH